jgi:hypothetical protein
MIPLWNVLKPPYDYMIALKYEILNLLPVNHMNEGEDYDMNIRTCAPYEWRWWWDYDSQKYIYVTCALYEKDDETMIYLHEYMFYVHHIKFNPTAP